MAEELGGVSVSVSANLGPLQKGYDAALKQSQAFEKQAAGTFKALETSANNLGGTISRQFTQIGGVIAGALSVRQIVAWSDSITKARNQLTVATGSVQAAEKAFDGLYEVSQRTRTSFDANVQLYNRLSIAAKELGVTQNEVMTFAEGVGQALAISGASATESRSAILQLSQALSNSVIQAQEFNSLLENAPRLARAAADGWGKTGISLGELRKQVLDGKVASDDFFRALQSQLPKLQAEFSKTTATIGQALTVLDNALGKFVGGSANALGISGMVAKAIVAVSENLELLAGVGIAAAVTAFVRFISTVNLATVAMAAFNGIVAANPIGLVAVAIGAAVGAMVAFRNETIKVGGVTVQVGGLLNAVWTTISESIKGVVGWIANLALALGKLITFDFEGAANALSAAGASLRTSGEAMIAAWTAAFKPLAEALKKTGEETEGVTTKTKAATKEFTEAKTKLDQQVQAYSMLVAAYREGSESVVTAKSAIEELTAIQAINEKVTAAERAQLIELIRTLGDLKKAAAIEELRQGYSAELEATNALIAARGIESAELRTQVELIRIRNQYGAAAAESLKGEILLLEQRRDVLASDKRISDMKDQIELAELEMQMVGKTAREREAALAVLRKEQELKKAGIDLTSEQAQQEIALTRLLSEKQVELDRMREAQRELQQVFERSFDRIGSAITEMFVQGKGAALEWKNVLRGVLSEIAQEFIKLAAINPLKNAIFGGSAPTLGGGGGFLSGLSSLFSSPSAGSLAGTAMVPGPGGGMFPMIHTGGIVGNDNLPMKHVANDVFAGAPRFHSGLMPDEFPAILQKGEGVFTRAQMAAMGGGGTKVEVIDMRSGGAPIRPEVMTDGRVRVIVRDEIQTAIPGIVDMSAAQVQDRVERGGSYAASFR